MKWWLVFLASIALAAPVTAQVAVIASYSGFVEAKAPGASWTPVHTGMVISAGTMISTGFHSRAELNLGTATISLQPLTRLSLQELVRRGGFVRTNLALRIGRIHAEVKTAKGLSQDFEVHSPISTAAVRGTGFIFDSQTLTVLHGLVAFSNRLNMQTLVGLGEHSTLVGFHFPESSRRAFERETRTEIRTNPERHRFGQHTQSLGHGSLSVNFQ